MMGNVYEVRIWFWTMDMNTYESRSVKGLTEDQAYSLYSTIVIDGTVTQTDLFEAGDLIRMRNEDGDHEL